MHDHYIYIYLLRRLSITLNGILLWEDKLVGSTLSVTGILIFVVVCGHNMEKTRMGNAYIHYGYRKLLH